MDLKSIEWVMVLLITAFTLVLVAVFHKKLAATSDRVDRVKKDYVHQDNLEAHLKRNEKRFDKADEKPDRLIAGE